MSIMLMKMLLLWPFIWQRWKTTFISEITKDDLGCWNRIPEFDNETIWLWLISFIRKDKKNEKALHLTVCPS
jgi:hypothetical protein